MNAPCILGTKQEMDRYRTTSIQGSLQGPMGPRGTGATTNGAAPAPVVPLGH
ncbi:MAG: hypothetical protein JW829_07895 [Pirellulales bacterium]|nr:hypothetical protein [Pirellulales bacterium]